MFEIMRKFLFLGLLAMLLAGCKTHERIVEVVRTDTLIVKDVQRDSVYVEREKHDSIYINQKGDTVLIEKFHTEWRDRWRDREKHDTLYVAKHDTISQTITKTDVKEKERKVTWWERVRMTLGDILLIILFCMAVLWLVKYYLKKVVRP